MEAYRLLEKQGSAQTSAMEKGTDPTDGSELEVLVVEDNLLNQKILQRLLKHLTKSATIANNGKEGVALAKSHPFDLILMDIMMPVMDGIEATKHIRACSSPCRNLPIIAVTAHEPDVMKRTAYAAGMDDFIQKPVTLNELKEKLEKVKSGGYSRQPAAEASDGRGSN